MNRFRQNVVQLLGLALLVSLLTPFIAPSQAYDAAWNGWREDITRPVPHKKPPCETGECPPDTCDIEQKTKTSPVYAADGTLVWSDRDISFSGATRIGLKRTYNSFDYRAGLFGRGWVTAQESSIARTWRAVTQANSDGSPKVATDFAPEPIWMSGYGRRYVLEEYEDTCGTPGMLNFTFEKLADGRFKQVFDGSERYSIYSEQGVLLQEYSDKDSSSVYYEYDDQQLLVRQFDSYGFSLDFIYNEQGFVSEVTDQAGRIWSYNYDEYGRLTQMVNPDGNSRDYGYQRIDNIGYSQHLLTSIDDNMDDPVLRVSYDNLTIDPAYAPSMRVSSYTESDGHQHDYSYASTTHDGKPATRVTKQTRQVGSGTVLKSQTFIAEADTYLVVDEYNSTDNLRETITYNDNGKITSKNDIRGNLTEHEYDDHGRRIQTTEFAGTADARIITKTYWGDTDRVASINNYDILETRFTYDDNLRLLSKTEVDLISNSQRVWTYSYHPNSIDSQGTTILGKIASIDGPRAGTEDTVGFSYDSKGQVIQIDYPLGKSATYTYDSTGQPVTITDQAGRITEMAYNSKGRMIQRVRNNHTTEYSYNGQGLLTEFIDERGGVTTLSYNDQNRITEVMYPTGDYLSLDYSYQSTYTEISSSYYGADDSLISTNVKREDPLSSLSISGYLDSTSDQVYQNEYNNLDELTSSTRYGQFSDTSATTTSTSRYSYDQWGRLTRMINGLGGSTTLGYDVMDRLVQVTDPNSSITNFQYNSWGDVTRLESGDSGITTYQYDPSGNRTNQVDGNTLHTKYSYDAQNRPVTIDYEGTGYDVTLKWDEGQNGVGRLTSVSDGSGSSSFVYNEQGRITNQSANIATTLLGVSYQYDDFGQLAQITYPSGLIINYSHDDFGRLNSIQNGSTSQSLVSDIVYHGSLVSSYKIGNGLVAERLCDSSGRLYKKRYGSGYTLTSTFDNQSSVVQQDRLIAGMESTSIFQYDSGGHLITDADSGSSEDLFFTYDAVGNRLTWQSSGGGINETYSYHQQSNQLDDIAGAVVIHDAAGNIIDDGIRTLDYNAMNRLEQVIHNQLNIPAVYTYNFLNQRVRKQLTDGHGTDIRYIYGLGGELLGEYDARGNGIREYVYSSYESGSIRELIAQIEADGTLIYIHTDHLETPRAATNQRQTVVWAWSSDAFGVTDPNEDVDGDGVAVTVNHRFPGQYFDSESGLHYNWHRFYDPSTGRYISADPIGLAGGMNLYAYVGGNPINWIDPEGLTTSMCTAPLHAIGGKGKKSGWDVKGNPLYHKYLCVDDGNGGKTCGGQDQRGKKWYDPISGPGKPSNDSYDKDRCEEAEPDDKCIENCLLRKFGEPRPGYGIPFGTDCQEWADDALEYCRDRCRAINEMG